ncbi:DUF4097 family beta strand repeat-containing protein [Fulvivirgaceae bacterium BMA12]|uniref:DUF4097 family beta strand repeat-containing protein n=1 Tax=Agaribacillus aureus TaxID=3051825 RepID=A0ABT8L3X4_9BACT|nr:DUF4097 family beta strand repeat-containing protein [Fulvivirgaceae bacterium BMA12]
MIYRIILTTVIVQGLLISALGQTKLQVLTKIVEKSFVASSSTSLQVDGQKSDIRVNTWNRNEVRVVLKLISKSPSKSVAEKELDYQRYILEKKKEIIHLKNYLVIPQGVSKLQSIQVASYEITVPRGCKMTLTNQYGDVEVYNLSGVVNMNVKYGKIRLENLNAAIQIHSYFGDLIVRNVDGHLKVNANHTKINLDDIAGDVKLNSTLGDVYIGTAKDIKSLDIIASKADITLENPDYQQFNFSLKSKFGDVLVPDQYQQYFRSHTRDNKSFVYEPLSKGSSISLITSFGNIIAK